LSKRESEVLALTMQGHNHKSAGGLMGISDKTVWHHANNIYKKTRTQSLVQALLLSLEIIR
jgi:DNA-binding CsgD family transcriptional regulator